MDLTGPARFGFLTLPDYSLIACANAIEALRMANRVAERDIYTWRIVTPDGTPAMASNGLALQPTSALGQAGRFDLVFVCGGLDVRRAAGRAVLTAVRGLARSGVALGALCTGSFVLAEAGLLRGYRCAIHWEVLPAIREEFPAIKFVDDLYAIDRDRLTCTGGIAPLDMMLAVIEARLGRKLAARVADQFIVERGRAGEERQPTMPSTRIGGDKRLLEAVRLIEEGIAAPRSAAEIAAATGLSRRQLERLFRQHFATTPAAFSASIRLDRARTLLRQTTMPVTGVAVACGFGSAAHFSTAFRGRFGHAPRAERIPHADPGREQ